MAFDDYQIPTRPMTPDDVLGALIDVRRACELDFMVKPLSMEMTIREWRDEYELGNVRAIGKWMNEMFGLHLLEFEYRAALTPPKRRTLRDLCGLISRHAQAYCMQPVTVLGDTSLAAGAFLALRRIFIASGIDVSDLKPSSQIEPFLTRHGAWMIPAICTMAPARMPIVLAEAPVTDALGTGLGGSICGVFLCKLLGLSSLMWMLTASIPLFALAWLTMVLSARPKIRIAHTSTFADLCRILAGERSRDGPGFPVVVHGRI
jgi:hypothetical protein